MRVTEARPEPTTEKTSTQLHDRSPIANDYTDVTRRRRPSAQQLCCVMPTCQSTFFVITECPAMILPHQRPGEVSSIFETSFAGRVRSNGSLPTLAPPRCIASSREYRKVSLTPSNAREQHPPFPAIPVVARLPRSRSERAY